mmetsp:Transcript_84640/g.262905  ORF Transcript_84640/g.262905 Transcript_84640/m.262905 type:complete len:213 (-) Transcript_84640:693-1331(-)
MVLRPGYEGESFSSSTMYAPSLSKFTWFSLTLSCLSSTRFAARNWLSWGRRLVPGSRGRLPVTLADPSTEVSHATTSALFERFWVILRSTTSTSRASLPPGRLASVDSPLMSSSDSSCSDFAPPTPKAETSTLWAAKNRPSASTLSPTGGATRLLISCPTKGAVSFTSLEKHSSSVSHEKNFVLLPRKLWEQLSSKAAMLQDRTMPTMISLR